MFELKYGHKLISGRSIFSQKLPPEMRNILLLVEAYEYKNKSSTDTTREEIRSVVLTHFK